MLEEYVICNDFFGQVKDLEIIHVQETSTPDLMAGLLQYQTDILCVDAQVNEIISSLASF